tara:strand:- start:1308 stop:1703 length:396 start_codon:yes stop_codon:yes gene_type:complete
MPEKRAKMQAMMITHKTLISDPGHAWLAIDHAELAELDILQLISSYSYELKTDEKHLVLLEEDCDLTTYLRHKFDDPEEWRAFTRECDEAYDEFDFVRGLPHYQRPLITTLLQYERPARYAEERQWKEVSR